jgi:hypothetical protein
MEKSNQQRLEEYLVGKNGYLKEKLSNGKVIMLSGKWGSGKTHFWKNIIEKDLIEFQTKKQKAYVYSSLYGNRIIDKIEDNIYAQAYLCSVGGKNAVISGYEKVKDFGKRFGSFCSLLDVSKLVDGIDDIQQKNIKKSAFSYLENGGIVCFDDFERKSKDIDLNDLFGFISHLAIDLNCKVVIILNDDVFEGNEKDMFSRVKEKSVSKFLKYEPDIKDLFNLIFYGRREDNKKKFKYLKLRKYKQIILKTIEETQELNARIYIQVLDNLIEWVEKNQETSEIEIEWLILITVNFILNHKVFTKDENNNVKVKGEEYLDSSLLSKIKIKARYEKDVDVISDTLYKLEDESLKVILENNRDIFKSKYFIKLRFGSYFLINNKTFEKINNFIESGILIDE